MKQYITKEQWNELNIDEKDTLLCLIYPTIPYEAVISSRGGVEMQLNIYFRNYGINIGQMIEFLGIKNNHYIDDDAEKVCWHVEEEHEWGVAIGWWGKEELCDTLWEAVKYKLNETTRQTKT